MTASRDDRISAEGYDRNYRDRELVGRILSYFRADRRAMLTVSAAIVAGSLIGVALPIVLSRTIDQVATAGFSFAAVALAAAAILLLSVSDWGASAVSRMVGTRAVGNVVLRLRRAVFDAVLGHDLSFFDRYPTGGIVSRVLSDTQTFSQVVLMTIDVVSEVFLALLIFAYLFTIDVPLTLIALLMVPACFSAALGFRRISRRVVTQSRRAVAGVSGHVHETMSGIGVAKSFRKEQLLYDQFAPVNEQAFRFNRRHDVVFFSFTPLLISIAGLGSAALVYAGGIRAGFGGLSIGEWYLYLLTVRLLWFRLAMIASFWNQFQRGLAAGERVFALLDAEPHVVQTGSAPVPAVTGRLELRNVRFHYTEGEGVFDDFSLTIHPRETLALVGHTGSGKSSVTKLVARFYEFQGGEILVDGRDIRSLDLAAYRSHLGFVTQVPFLFDGSVLDNIRYGRSAAGDAEAAAAAARVGGGDWIGTLPRGLATEVTERGRNLSLGQRQLIALSRVLLQDPAVLILDEATASIDPLTEALVQEGMEELLRERTAIVIAHRLSTIKRADRIVVLRAGEIIEQGDHERLLQAGGHYAELYNAYFRHQSLEYVQTAPVIGTTGGDASQPVTFVDKPAKP